MPTVAKAVFCRFLLQNGPLYDKMGMSNFLEKKGGEKHVERVCKAERRKWLCPRNFLILEALLFGLFLCSDFTGRTLLFSSAAWKFFVIVAAFCYAAMDFAFAKEEDRLSDRRLFLLLGMAFTLVSDVLLLDLVQHYTVGVCTFFAAQIFHALEIPRSKRRAIVSFSVRFGTTLCALLILGFLHALTPLYVAVSFYGPQLLGNLAEHLWGSFRFSEKEERFRSILLAVAFALFLACDACVGLSHLGISGVGQWIWIFYAPSQALIAVSCASFGGKNKAGEAIYREIES